MAHPPMRTSPIIPQRPRFFKRSPNRAAHRHARTLTRCRGTACRAPHGTLASTRPNSSGATQ